MFKCPNCGGDITFIPGKDFVYCPWCGSKIKIKETDTAEKIKETGEGVADEHASSENVCEPTYTEGIVCTCSQCGGELFTADDTGITFCPYCGSQNIISSKMRKEDPQYIIPFNITKEECVEIYKKKIRKNIFLKSEFRKPEIMERFRGIYMPFWKYSGDAEYSNDNWIGEETEMGFSRTTIHENSYAVTARGSFDNFFCDATASFPDDISSFIQPYDIEGMVPFNTDMTAGFYADTGNIPDDVYNGIFQEAIEMKFSEQVCDTIKRRGMNPASKHGGVTMKNEIKPVRCYMPVWFMSVRNKKGKMSYAVINGQTGKIHADMPLSVPKLLILSLICAIPFFLFFSFFPAVITPIVLLCIIMAMLILSLFPALKAADEEYEHEKNLDNWGKRYAESGGNDIPVYSEKDGYVKSSGAWPRIISTILTILGLVSGLILILTIKMALLGIVIIIVCSLIGRLILTIKVERKYDFIADAPGYVRFLRTLPVIICILIGITVILVNPVDDISYYGVAFLGIIGLFIQIAGILKRKNAVSIRKPVQLEKRDK